MNSIVLMAAGIILIVWPDEYVKILIDVAGAAILVTSAVMLLDFLSKPKSMVNFLFFILALALLIIGIFVLLYDMDTIAVLGWLFGVFLIIDGLHGVFHALIFARRSHRKGWWIMFPLSLSLVVCGVLIIVNRAWWVTPASIMNAIGWVLLFSSIVSALRLIWVWPIKSE